MSFADDGRPWAEWICGALERAGQRVANEAWDVVPGTHRVAWLDRVMRQAGCTIAVVSDGYLESPEAFAQWGAAWSPPVAGGSTADRPLLVVRVTDRPIPGLLGQIAPIDLVDRGESAAEAVLIGAVRARLGLGREASPARGEGVGPGEASDTGEVTGEGRVRFPGAGGAPVFPAELPAVWNVPRASARFVGRADELGRLDAALADGAMVAVTGLAGIGKSSLAAEFVSRHRMDYQAVWWVPAGRPELVGQRVRQLAPALGLPAHAEPAAVLNRLDAAGGRWLLVLDDVGDAADLPGWLRPSEGAGRVLATSRGSAWDWRRQLDGGWNGQVLGLAPFTRGESVALLGDRLGAGVVDGAPADRIAELLGDHPLALDQAARRIIDVHGRTDGFLTELERGAAGGPEPGQGLLAALGERPVPGRPGVTVETLWDASIQHLDAEHPAAGALLRLAAHGDTTRFPLRALTADQSIIPDAGLRAAASDPMELGATTAALERAGLAHWDGASVAMHPLVRSAVRAHTAPEQSAELRDGLGRMLHAALPENVTANPDAWPIWRELLPHALATLEATAPAADTPHTAWLAEHTAAYLVEHGHPEQAEALAARAVDAQERLAGPDHPDTLTAREVHIRAALNADHPAVAGPLAERNAADRERVLGSEHPDTLTSRDTLALTYQQAGYLDHAQELFTENLADRQRILGPEHPATLESRHNLGSVLDDAGRADDATRVLRPTLLARDRILGPEHPDTLTTRYQLATTYQRMGATADALAHAEPTLAARERILGPDHPNTLDSRHDLGATYHQAGRWNDAARELDHSLAARERVLGPDHPDTLDSTDALGRVHRAAGRPELAVPLFERAVAGREQSLSADHPATAQSREQLAAAHVAAGRPVEAIPHLERVLDRHERVLGPSDPHTMHVREDLTSLYRNGGHLEGTHHHLERQLAARLRTDGVGHERTLRTATDLAEACRQTGRLPQAVTLHERVHDTRRELLGPAHPDTRASRSSLADTYRQAGRQGDAVPLYRAALSDAMREHGPFHEDTIRTRRALADTQHRPRTDRPSPPERPAPVELPASEQRPAAPEVRFPRPGP
ncbi:tetratricopeptide repeat protein [Frankia sp. AiPa1]|nr:tetratricopeptide repeat protein [Frankia sp. AiPa1]